MHSLLHQYLALVTILIYNMKGSYVGLEVRPNEPNGEKNMITTGVFDYINVLGKAADGSWLRNQAIANNIANVDTPNYKRQDVSFAAELQQAMGDSRYRTLDEKVAAVNGKLSHITPHTYTDSAGYSYRLDGNNVDIDNENVELASNQIVYNGIVQSIDSEFQNLKTVIK